MLYCRVNLTVQNCGSDRSKQWYSSLGNGVGVDNVSFIGPCFDINLRSKMCSCKRLIMVIIIKKMQSQN